MSSVAVFAKAQYEVLEDANIYAMIGYGKTQIDGTKQSNVDISESGVQWGVGASYDIDTSFTVFTDYTSLLSNADGKLFRENGVNTDAFTVGLTYTF